jgi:membrane fusion protein (multidrug efflux system)
MSDHETSVSGNSPSARQQAVETAAAKPAAPAPPPAVRVRSDMKWYILGGIGVVAVIAAILLRPWAMTALNTVSTDDAYVNGHVTFVAARVPGQVMKVLVDDNKRVKKDQVLLRLDTQPYKVQVDIKQAAVDVAKSQLTAAEAQARGLVAQARSNRFKLDHSIEDVHNQIANLSASIAALDSKKANLKLAKANFKRGEELVPNGALSREELDLRRQAVEVAEAGVEQARQNVYAIRVGLGLSKEPEMGGSLSDVPKNLDQEYSTVRKDLADLMQSAAQLGYFPTSWNATPKQAITDFYAQDAKGDLDRIYAKLIDNAPTVVEARANLEKAFKDLADAELNLSYCDVKSEIDGVVTSRDVNPGNNVQVGQQLMAVRSITEIWIDANFKETQLDHLRIGQRVECEVDMYGSKHTFEGRITGFTMGTGQSLALLPPQNATGNFVKIVQRLPVRIVLTDYDPDKYPLFIGTSVEPHVYYKEPAKGKHAGDILQPYSPNDSEEP